jgi:Fe2+ or Zn2+ uptake regulation protein
MSRSKYHDAILKVIGDKHLTVDDIYDSLKKKYESVGIATVYRNIDNLVDEGLVVRIVGIFDKTYVEKYKGPHIHLVDRDKEKIVDVFLPDWSWLQLPDDFVQENIQFAVIGHAQKGKIEDMIQQVKVSAVGQAKSTDLPDKDIPFLQEDKIRDIQEEDTSDHTQQELDTRIEKLEENELSNSIQTSENISAINEKPENNNKNDRKKLEKVFRGF